MSFPQCAAVSTQLSSTRTPAQWNARPLKRETCQGCEPRAHGAPDGTCSVSVSFLGSKAASAAGGGKTVEIRAGRAGLGLRLGSERGYGDWPRSAMGERNAEVLQEVGGEQRREREKGWGRGGKAGDGAGRARRGADRGRERRAAWQPGGGDGKRRRVARCCGLGKRAMAENAKTRLAKIGGARRGDRQGTGLEKWGTRGGDRMRGAGRFKSCRVKGRGPGGGGPPGPLRRAGVGGACSGWWVGARDPEERRGAAGLVVEAQPPVSPVPGPSRQAMSPSPQSCAISRGRSSFAGARAPQTAGRRRCGGLMVRTWVWRRGRVKTDALAEPLRPDALTSPAGATSVRSDRFNFRPTAAGAGADEGFGPEQP